MTRNRSSGKAVDPACRQAPSVSKTLTPTQRATVARTRPSYSAARLALQLLESESTFVLASDAHNLTARAPDLRHGEAVAARVLGSGPARRLVHDNPWRIVRWHFEERPAAPAVPAGGPRVAAPIPAPVALPVQSEQPPAGANAELLERLARVVRRELLDALRHQVAEHVLVALIRRLNRALDAELRTHSSPGTREPP